MCEGKLRTMLACIHTNIYSFIYYTLVARVCNRVGADRFAVRALLSCFHVFVALWSRIRRKYLFSASASPQPLPPKNAKCFQQL